MTHTVNVYAKGILLGTAVGTLDSFDLTTYVGAAPGDGRHVQVTATSGAKSAPQTYFTRIMSGSGTATLVMKDKDSLADS